MSRARLFKNLDMEYSQNMNSIRKAIVKRRYSRAGCVECKRRKIKCNEAHPICGNCLRVKVPCSYPDPHYRNRPRRQHKSPILEGTDLDTQFSQTSNGTFPTSVEPFQAVSAINHYPYKIEGLDMILFENVFDDASTLVHGLADFDNLAMVHPTAPASSNGSLKPFSSNIILNEPPKDNVFFDEEELQDYLSNGTDIDTNPELARFLTQFSDHATTHHDLESKCSMSNVQLIEKIAENFKLSKEELEYFSNITSRELLYFIYPFASTIENNTVMQVILEYLVVFKYLVYALIALSASCQFTITGDRKHDHNQKKFTAICMRLLVASFSDLKSQVYSLGHIEGLILTVLILTMLYSDISFVGTSKMPSWISHLKEARSLLIKYNTIKTQGHVYKQDGDTCGITIAKLLFFSYDWISKLSMPVSQISHDDLTDLRMFSSEIDHTGTVEPEFQALVQMGIMIPGGSTHTGFNLFLSLTKEVIEIVVEIIALASARNDGTHAKQIPPGKIARLMSMIDVAFQQQIVPNIKPDNSFLVEISNPAHPMYPDKANRIVLPLSAYGIDRDNGAEEAKYYSWCDISQRLHCFFLYLKVLTSPGLLHLPRSHPMIQSIVKEVLGLMFFLKSKNEPYYTPEIAVAESQNYYLSKNLFDYRAIMIQLPFRMSLDLADDEDDFERLELFFRGLVKLGSGSSIPAVQKAEMNRDLARERNTDGSKIKSNDLDYLADGLPIY